MDIERVHPQLREQTRKLPKIDVGKPLLRRLARFGARHLVPRAKVAGVTVQDVRAGAARARIYTPETRSGAALIWIHGGGMVIGAPRQDDAFCAETAARLGVTVFSADYRMAPEHPFPVPQDDCRAVWDWVQTDAARLGVDPTRVAIGGGSAGGGLAASLVNALHDGAGAIQPVAQWLLYPMLDDRTAADTSLDVVDHFVWTNRDNRVGWTALLSGTAEPGAADVPAAAAPARRDDLTGLPPTWIGVGDIDLFFDEDAAYAQRLRAAGVPVQLDVLEAAPHGFENIGADAPVVQAFVDRARDWLGAATAAHPAP